MRSLRTRGPVVIATMIVAGCGDGGGDGDDGDSAEPRTATVTVSATALAQIPNVQKLTLQFSPSHLYEPDGIRNVRVFTDGNGENRVIAANRPADCDPPRDPAPPPPPTPQPGQGGVPGVPQENPYAGTTPEPGTTPTTPPPSGLLSREECDWVSNSELTLIDSLSGNPLPIVYIARNYGLTNVVLGRERSAITVGAYGRPNLQDSYVHLLDGRECEVRVIYPSTNRFPIPTFTINKNEHWHIKLNIDFAGTEIDPAECVTGYDVRLNGSATVERMSGPT